ncbi:MAG: hypothetical protein QOI73_467 [Solirubrobacteraceae bacterium]|nr:hypothetical protein [Solirubrobacteraceae bacterium]
MATTTARPAALVHPKPNEAGASDALTSADRTSLLRHMLLMRATEERALTLYRQGKVPGSYYDGRGQEAVSVGSSFALAPEDRACILHRDLGAHLVRGVKPGRVLAQMMGRAGGVTEGRDGNMHFGDRELGCIGMVSMLPDMAVVACGLARAFQMRGEPRVAMTWFGEGSTANGVWHEAMNLAGVSKLPVVFILENNQFAYSTPNDREFAVDPVARAEGYGFPGIKVDGNDVEAVFEAAAEATERARRGGGPTLIEAETMRMHGHGAHDDMRYVPKDLFEHWSERDPVENYERKLSAEGIDVEAVFEATRAARERAIAGGGPTLIEAVTMRMHGHGAHDDMKYVPKALVEEWRKRDPIDRQSARASALGHDVDALREEVRAEVERAAEVALAGPMPDPATATDRVFHPRDADEILLEDGDAPWSGFGS